MTVPSTNGTNADGHFATELRAALAAKFGFNWPAGHFTIFAENGMPIPQESISRLMHVEPCTVNLDSFVLEFAHMPGAVHEKLHILMQLDPLISLDHKASAIGAIETHCRGHIVAHECLVGHQSATFFLRVLDLWCSPETSALNISLCQTLIANLDIAHARHLKLPRFTSQLGPAHFAKMDLASAKSLYFARASLLQDPSVQGFFGKFIADVKGVPDEAQSTLLPFIAPLLAANFEADAFIALLDRTSKRNSPLAAHVLLAAIKASKPAAVPTAYYSIIAALAIVDNGDMQKTLAAALQLVPTDSGLFAHLASCIKAATVAKNRELLARLAVHLAGPHLVTTDGAEVSTLLAKELANENTLAAMTEIAAKMDMSRLSPFLETNLKATQKLATKAAILGGLLRAGTIGSLPAPIIHECFAASALKDAQAATQSSPQLATFATGAWAALLAAPATGLLDAPRRKEWIAALSKPGGCAVFAEKGWAGMSDELLLLWAVHVVIPALASDAEDLLGMASASLTWIALNSRLHMWRRILKHLRPFSVAATDCLADTISKCLSLPSTPRDNLARMWEVLERIASSSSLQSRKLALCAHHSRLIELGCGSWAGLLRAHCVPDEFLARHYGTFVQEGSFSSVESAEERMLVSMLSLTPSLVTGSLGLSELLEQGTTAPSPPHAFVLAVCRAASTAIGYSAAFENLRTRILCDLLALPQSDALTATLYVVAREALDEHGPLLVSLALRVSGREPDWNWNIPDWTGMLDSCIAVTRCMQSSEFAFVATVMAGAAPSIPDTTVLAHWVDALLPHLDGWDAAQHHCTTAILLALARQLLPRIGDAGSTSLTRLLVEIAAWPHFCPAADDLRAFAEQLQTGSAEQRAALLRVLVAWAAAHAPPSLDPPLGFACWLLTHAPCAASDADGADTPRPLEEAEVALLAQELLAVVPSSATASADLHQVLAQIALLETEAGRTGHVAALLGHLVAAAGALVQSADDLAAVTCEWSRLLAVRTTPTHVLRGRNIDRTALDFTRATRHALLQALQRAPLTRHAVQLSAFAFGSGFGDPSAPNRELLFALLVDAVAGVRDQGTLAQLRDHLQTQAQAPGPAHAQAYAAVLLGKVAGMQPLDGDARWALIERLLLLVREGASEAVRTAAAGALQPHLQQHRQHARDSTQLQQLAAQLADALDAHEAASTPEQQRGTAHALATVLGAGGTALLRQLRLPARWQTQLDQPGATPGVVAALAAVELTARQGGRAFEPFLLPLVPAVLGALGDAHAGTRAAAERCADALQAAFSALATALLLPPLLAVVAADVTDARYSWRAKLGAVAWLASMARAAGAARLAPWLPRIVPALMVPLGDVHEEAHLAAHAALTGPYAAVIRSPEIRAALPAILRAVCDPPRHAASCLADIIATSFGHAVDGPSLALLLPLLVRVLQERGTGHMALARRRAITIIASLGALMDPAELAPYLPVLLPPLLGVLGDAVPAVRAGAARACGLLVRLYCRPGTPLPPALARLLPALLDRILAPPAAALSAVDRAGAAQAAAHVATAQGLDAVAALLAGPDARLGACLFPRELGSAPCDAPVSSDEAREAALHFVATLATTTSTGHAALYARVLTPPRLWAIMAAVADDDEGIREVAATTARALLLRQALLLDVPAALAVLLRGCSDPRWRVRLHAFTVLADLLPALAAEDTLPPGHDHARVLSSDLRARVLSRIFLGRFDPGAPIRNAAFSLWKAIVSHPPRAILDMLPVLVDDIVAALTASHGLDHGPRDTGANGPRDTPDTPAPALNADRFDAASAALNDIIARLADRVLLPLARRLSDLFAATPHDPGVHCGILAAGLILLQGAIQPALAPAPHAPPAPVSRAQADEALRCIEACATAALLSPIPAVHVRAATLVHRALALLPAQREPLLTRLLAHPRATDALRAVLAHRPRLLLLALVARLRAIDSPARVDATWWAHVLQAAGPHAAPHVAALLTHLHRIGALRADATDPLAPVLLTALAAFDPDTDADADADAEAEPLEDQVDSALFSLGQFLETLWSARGEHRLAALLLRAFCTASPRPFGAERFYDPWCDRLLASVPEDPTCADALVALVEAAAGRDELAHVLVLLADSWASRSSVRASARLAHDHPVLLAALVKTALVPALTAPPGHDDRDRLKIAQFARDLVLHVYAHDHAALPLPLAAALLGALIRALSEQRGVPAHVRLALLALPCELLALAPAATKPFHPQLARLLSNLLKDLPPLGSQSVVDAAEHAHALLAHTAALACARLLVRMARPEPLVSELRLLASPDDACDEDAVYVARVLLLSVLALAVDEARTHALPLADPVLALLDTSLRALMGLDADEYRSSDLAKEAARVAAAAIPIVPADIALGLTAHLK